MIFIRTVTDFAKEFGLIYSLFTLCEIILKKYNELVKLLFWGLPIGLAKLTALLLIIFSPIIKSLFLKRRISKIDNTLIRASTTLLIISFFIGVHIWYFKKTDLLAFQYYTSVSIINLGLILYFTIVTEGNNKKIDKYQRKIGYLFNFILLFFFLLIALIIESDGIFLSTNNPQISSTLLILDCILDLMFILLIRLKLLNAKSSSTSSLTK